MSVSEALSDAQNELLEWIKDYVKTFNHSPSIRQMMTAMGLKSPAPIQSRLKHLQEKGHISWQEGKARTLQLISKVKEGIPVLGSVAAGGLIETYPGFDEQLDVSDILNKKGVFALTVNGDSMIDANIKSGDVMVVDRALDPTNNSIVLAVLDGEFTVKRIKKSSDELYLMPANENYQPVKVTSDIDFQIWGVVTFIIHKAL